MNEPRTIDRVAPLAWAAAARAGVLYFLLVFTVAFALGAARVLWVAPRLGALRAVLLEAPVMLAASWLASRWCTRRLRLGAEPRARLVMGVVAFAVLMVVEFAVEVYAFGDTPGGYLAKWRAAPGAIGLLAQLGFAVVPRAELAWCRRQHPP